MSPGGGEAERAASMAHNSRRSYGLALNKLAHLDVDNIDSDLAAYAQTSMTDDDLAWLQAGG